MKLPCTLVAAALLAACAGPKQAKWTAPEGWNPQPMLALPDRSAIHLQKLRFDLELERKKAADSREQYVAEHPDLPPEAKRLILARSYALDWPTEWVRASMGEPQNSSRTVSANGVFESWSYRSGNEVIYFLNGRVVRWYHAN